MTESNADEAAARRAALKAERDAFDAAAMAEAQAFAASPIAGPLVAFEMGANRMLLSGRAVRAQASVTGAVGLTRSERCEVAHYLIQALDMWARLP